MGTGRRDVNVFSYRVPATVNITSANLDFQLIRAPHASPANSRVLRIKKLLITQTSGIPTTVVFSDLDATDSTATGRGSANAALLTLSLGNGATSGLAFTSVFSEEELPGVVFEAGVVVQAKTLATSVSAEFEKY